MHTLAWMAWVGMVMGVALSTSNPLYLAVILLAVVLVGILAPKSERAVAGLRGLVIFGVTMLAISLAIATVNGSYGAHVLFHVPGPDAPRWLGGLAFGGPVTAEALIGAAIRGGAILCVLLAFGVFNGAVSPSRVLRTAPASLFHAGLVVTVGLALLPSTVDDVRRLREIRALRGAPSGWRSLPSLVVPAVIGGLERSLRLAEAMEARGFASASRAPSRLSLLGVTAAPLLLAGAALWYYYPALRLLGGGLAVGGAGALVGWGWLSSRSKSTTRLHSEPLTLADRAGIVFAGAVLLVVFAGRGAGLLDLSYNPFADLGSLRFEPLGAAVALACAWPAMFVAARNAEPASRSSEASRSRGRQGALP